ncbi:MAG TPA: phage holin family protein [Pseudogracilibacillus sp.]|nr:phage holin family protein [Pseudogracilibacillus sp.]
MRFILSWVTSILFNAIALYAVAQLFSSFYLADFGTALLASLIIFILNVFVRPILVIFTLPATILTLGLFLFVINAITLMITQAVMSSDFVISNFGVAIIAAIIISIINAVLSSLVSNK